MHSSEPPSLKNEVVGQLHEDIWEFLLNQILLIVSEDYYDVAQRIKTLESCNEGEEGQNNRYVCLAQVDISPIVHHLQRHVG